MEAIYLITPNEKSVQGLMSDFQSQHRTQYRCAHVYFTEGNEKSKSSYLVNTSRTFNWYTACPEDIFNELCKHQVGRFIKTLKEINIAFTPYEMQVCSSNADDTICTAENTTPNTFLQSKIFFVLFK